MHKSPVAARCQFAGKCSTALAIRYRKANDRER
jgi:hypothetical protein